MPASAANPRATPRRLSCSTTELWKRARSCHAVLQACARVRAMLDIRLIREQPDFVKDRLTTRGGEDAAKIDELLRVDAERRKAET
ncbi:MAG: hypothetical protein ACXWAV_08255, partial [Chthoniobacterales bacterium]